MHLLEDKKNAKKRKKKKVSIYDDYDKLISAVQKNGDPFEFLTKLKNVRGGTDIDTSFLTGKKDDEIAFEVANEANIASMVRQVIEESKGAFKPRDTRIDDSAMPYAKNIYEWATRDEFAGTVFTPFMEQLLWGVIVFAEWCPRCSDVEWLYYDHKVDDTFLTFERKVCMLEHGICPSCGGRRSEFINAEQLYFYQELAVCAGQRSGKSQTVGGLLTPYMTHRILKMQKPAEVYNISSSTVLHGTFCALTYAQAKETLWEFYYGTLLESPWFREYHNMLNYYGEKYGQQLFKFNDTFVTYRCRNLMWYPAGPDKRILRGRTRIFAGVDEIGYFDNEAESKKIKMSASGVYDALDSSLLTIRGAAERLVQAGYDDVLNGMSMNVSSPAHRRDKIMSLVNASQTSKVIYGIHRPTWEINPTLPRSSKVISERYRTDPDGAERDYGAVPPLAANPFITDKQSIQECIGKHSNPVKMSYKIRKESGTKAACRWAKIDKIKKSKRPACLGIDAGHTNNSFACCVMTKDDSTGIATVDLLIEIMPRPGFPLNYTKIYLDVLCPIFENRNIKVFLADRWNSLKILSDASEEYGVYSQQYSLRYKDLWLPKTMLEQGTIVFPRLSKKGMIVPDVVEYEDKAYPHCFQGREMDHLVVQMLTVQDTGTKVLKGDGLTDDLWRAMAIASWGLFEEKLEEFFILDPGDAQKFRPAAIGMSRLGSGGGGTVGTGAQGSLSYGGNIGKVRTRSGA